MCEAALIRIPLILEQDCVLKNCVVDLRLQHNSISSARALEPDAAIIDAIETVTHEAISVLDAGSRRCKMAVRSGIPPGSAAPAALYSCGAHQQPGTLSKWAARQGRQLEHATGSSLLSLRCSS